MKITNWRKQTMLVASVLNAMIVLNPQCAFAQDGHISSYRVVGWQAELVHQSPNLANFYWEPITKRRILTTKHTGKQAEFAPLPRRTIVFNKLPLTTSKQRFLKQTAIAYSTHAAEAASALSYATNAPTTVISSSTLSVNAKLTSGNVDKSKVLAKGLVANQPCLSLTSIH